MTDYGRRTAAAAADDDDDDDDDARTPPPKRIRPHGGAKAPRRSPVAPSSRRKRCATCAGCRASECGACAHCLDKPKFGGENRLKKPCKLRVCLALAAS